MRIFRKIYVKLFGPSRADIEEKRQQVEAMRLRYERLRHSALPHCTDEIALQYLHSAWQREQKEYENLVWQRLTA